MKKIIVLIAFFTAIYPSFLLSQIVINEIVASNGNSLQDENLNTPDWIELYNTGDKDINLKNYRISDRDDYTNAWILPDTVIKAHGMLTIYASGEARVGSDNFIVESSGKGLWSYSAPDGFRFLYTEMEGDFSISARLNTMRDENLWSTFSLLIRDELTDGSYYASAAWLSYERKGMAVFYRDTLGKYPQTEYFKLHANYPNDKLEIIKHGDSLKFIGYDIQTWESDTINVYYPGRNKVYVGLAAARYDQSVTAQFAVRDFRINGTPIDCSKLKVQEFNCDIPGKSFYSGEIHTNFKLSSSGEEVFLWDASGEQADHVSFGELKTDVSYCRIPDGSDNFFYSAEPTPDLANKGGKLGYTPEPLFTDNSRWHNDDFDLTFKEPEEGTKIYYTTGSTAPDTNGVLYKTGSKIHIAGTTIVKAYAEKPDYIRSKTIVATFFTGRRPQLPIFSIVADSVDLWSEKKGIFSDYNIYTNLEIRGHYEFLDDSQTPVLEDYAGIKLHGTASAYYYGQKSMRLYARNKYGNSIMEYPFWGNGGLPASDKIVLRNGGQDWPISMLRDPFASVLANKIMPGLGLGYRGCVVYLNGHYWGIYNLRERFDEDYLAAKYDIPDDSVDIFEDNDEIRNGTKDEYFEITDSILSMDLAENENFKYACSMIDYKNLINYVIMRFYTGNFDWPGYNQKYWHSKDYDNKWHWFLYDSDLSMGMGKIGPDANLFKHMKTKDIRFTNLFFKFCENQDFKNEFANQFADYLNSTLQPDSACKVLDSLAAIIRPEIPYHHALWQKSVVNWEQQLDTLKDYIQKRYDYIYDQVKWEFKLEDTANVIIDTDGRGDVKINTLYLNSYPWQGRYFQDVPVRVSAIPAPGYEFRGWADNTLPQEPEITVFLDYTNNFTALFREKNSQVRDVVINEIMYKPSDVKDCQDWLELYNNSADDVDISGWSVKDGDNSHVYNIPEGTVINSGAYLIVCENHESFSKVYPSVKFITGDMNFGLGTNDVLRLFDKSGNLADKVIYSDISPWPMDAAGTGRTIELKNPDIDNGLALNWHSSFTDDGTPGKRNSAYTPSDMPYIYSTDLTVYPNPASEHATIKCKLPDSGYISIQLVDNLGNSAGNIYNGYRDSGKSDFIVNIPNISPGAYFILIKNSVSGRVYYARPFMIIK